MDGNQLVVRLPEGTRELTVPDDFRFTVNGQQMSVHQLKAGMKGTATITTRTTVTPVTVTEVKNGTVVVRTGRASSYGPSEGVKRFTQGDMDKRGVKIVSRRPPVQVSEFREGDRLSATIITSMPPRVMTEQEVNATLATAKAASGSAAPAAAPAARPAAAGTSSAGAAPPAGTYAHPPASAARRAERLGVAVVRVWRRQDAAEAPPARGRSSGSRASCPRDRRRPDDEAPPQQLADSPTRSRSRVTVRARPYARR